ncbi:MAG: alanine--tRNA ligase [Eubacteriales bacterium]|nr:alanine--tRNA ligase [Bacillota bacterium]MDY5345261.1 alanine--tRNA ligase [Eubacteriales bacterium]
MEKLTSNELRSKYLGFFKDRGHAVIPSASLIPENDPTVLFTTAGMHPLVPYLLGEKHPQGTRLTDVQICVRTGDIEEVGDASHCTFFEMLGNWSLGDYFKKEAISWSFEFLTKVLGIPLDRLSVSVFAGDESCPRDDESADIWASLGLDRERIFFLPKKNNWWGPAGITGPCGPDTEMFIDTGKPVCSPNCSPACDCGKYLEIWNNVFMQYFKGQDGKLTPLEKKNVDTGMGLERTLCILNGYKSVYETDLFDFAIKKLEELSGKKYSDGGEDMVAMRIIADHVRTATFMLGDVNGITPSNVDQGYVLRRLIRRAVRYAKKLGLEQGALEEIAKLYIKKYEDVYESIKNNAAKIVEELKLEEERFSKTLESGLKEFEKVITHIPTKTISGKTAFRLYDTFGFPLEMTVELAKENGFDVDTDGYEVAFKEHQEKSKLGADQKFKGGLADGGEETAKLHSATHLLNAALKEVLGDPNIMQKGSNITAERLRFDFNFDRPLTKEEIEKVEERVNAEIAKKADIKCEEMTVDEAKAKGAIGVFASKYGERVKVYTIGFSKEICGGPHASNTGDLGRFHIVKEQSSSAGVRRIKAVLTKEEN